MYVAVTTEVWSAVSEPARARKETVVDPAVTAMVAGTVSNALLLESEMTEPAAGAALASVTVQVVVSEEPINPGLHCTELMTGRVTRVRVVVVDLPLRVAVRVAD